MDIYEGYHVTDKVRKTLRLTQDFADLQNVNYIGTEHLLLALVSNSTGVAHAVLNDCGVTRELICEHLENRITGKVINE